MAVRSLAINQHCVTLSEEMGIRWRNLKEVEFDQTLRLSGVWWLRCSIKWPRSRPRAVKALATALLIDIGVDPVHGELMAIRDDLESPVSIGSVIVDHPPLTKRSVCDDTGSVHHTASVS